MSISGIGNSGFASKVAARIGRLNSQIQRVQAKLETSPNEGQIRKAERLVQKLADGAAFKQAQFSGNSLIYTAVALGNSVNFGQAMKQQVTAPPAPPPQEPPTTPPSREPPTSQTPPADTIPTSGGVDVMA